MKLFETEQNDEPELRFTHDREIVAGIPDKPENAMIYYIGNYPTQEILDHVDMYLTDLKPPNNYWDDVLETGDSREAGSGWATTGFEAKYMEYMQNNDQAYAEALHVRARALVRPIYIGHHKKKKLYSPARTCINFIEGAVRLPSETDHEMVITYGR